MGSAIEGASARRHSRKHVTLAAQASLPFLPLARSRRPDRSRVVCVQQMYSTARTRGRSLKPRDQAQLSRQGERSPLSTALSRAAPKNRSCNRAVIDAGVLAPYSFRYHSVTHCGALISLNRRFWLVVSSRAVGRRDAPGADAFASVAQGNPREAPPYEGIKLIRSRLRSCFSGHTSRSSLAKHAGYLGNVYVNEVFGFIFFMYKPFFPSPFPFFVCERVCRRGSAYGTGGDTN